MSSKIGHRREDLTAELAVILKNARKEESRKFDSVVANAIAQRDASVRKWKKKKLGGWSIAFWVSIATLLLSVALMSLGVERDAENVFTIGEHLLGVCASAIIIGLPVWGVVSTRVDFFLEDSKQQFNHDLEAIRIRRREVDKETLREQLRKETAERLQREREVQAEREREAYAQYLQQCRADAERYRRLTRSLRVWQEEHLMPTPQPYGVSPTGAEAWLRDWLTHMGARWARLTPTSGDGGVDIESVHFVAQVKHYTGSVPIAAIREHVGVAATDKGQREPLFFTSGSFPVTAFPLADRANMALFTYDVEGGDVHAVNDRARFLVKWGFNPVWWPASDQSSEDTPPAVEDN